MEYRKNKQKPDELVRSYGLENRFSSLDAWTLDGEEWVRTHDARPVPVGMDHLPKVTPMVGDTILYSHSGGPLTYDDAVRRHKAGDRLFYECFEVN